MLSSFTSSEEYKKDHKSIEIFAHFLDESYDSEDLLFFLASRFVVYNELEKRPSPNTKVAVRCLPFEKSIAISYHSCSLTAPLAISNASKEGLLRVGERNSFNSATKFI